MTHSHSAAPPSPVRGISSGGNLPGSRCANPLPVEGLTGVSR